MLAKTRLFAATVVKSVNMHVSKMQHRCQRTRRPLRSRRLGAMLSIELIIVLPILLAILLASVEFGILIMAQQGVGAAANMGAREAAKPSSSKSSVEAAVAAAVQGWKWKNDDEIVIYVDGVKDTGSLLATAPTGATVSVTVNVAMNKAAPDLLNTFGIKLAATLGHPRELTATYVTRKE